MVTVRSSVVLGAAAFLQLAGCVVEEDHPRYYGSGPTAEAPVAAAPSTSNGGTSTTPMVVQVDTDQTMSATGGDGVGVFVEYAKGGHWHVWWTCDTNQTSQSCDFSVTASAASGAVSNVDSSQLPGGFLTTPNPGEIDLHSTTTTEVDGVRFDTAPGTVLTVRASVGSLTDGAFLFFVQGGKLNGGFSGKLTNPLQFEPTVP
jgi:hypothetical protein